METQELTVLSTLALMPDTKNEIKTFSSKLLAAIENGEVNPLKVHVQLKAVESVVKAVNDSKEYKAAIRDEAEKHGKNFEKFGAKIELAEVGVKYDFTNCGHVYYNDVCEKITELEAKKKEYETLLKAVKESTTMIFDGEAIEVLPPVKSSTSSIKVTF